MQKERRGVALHPASTLRSGPRTASCKTGTGTGSTFLGSRRSSSKELSPSCLHNSLVPDRRPRLLRSPDERFQASQREASFVPSDELYSMGQGPYPASWKLCARESPTALTMRVKLLLASCWNNKLVVNQRGSSRTGTTARSHWRSLTQQGKIAVFPCASPRLPNPGLRKIPTSPEGPDRLVPGKIGTACPRMMAKTGIARMSLACWGVRFPPREP